MIFVFPVVVMKISPRGAGLIHRHDVEPIHMRLQCLPGIDLGHDDTGAEAPGLLCKPPATEPVARDNEPAYRQ